MILMSPGVSVIAAGIVSGLCFVIINGLRKGKSGQSEQESKSKRYIDNTRCACCLKPFVVGRGVECGECEARACRKGCSRWDSPDNSWYCLFCHQRRLWLRRNEKWIETFGGLSANHDAATHRFSTAKSQVFLGGADYAGIAPGVGLAAGGEEDAGDSMERVREFVEKIVDSLVGNVDEIAVDRVYDHRAYDELVENYREPLAGALARLAVSLQLSISNKPAADTPTMAHAALRDLVERAVEEARRLPGLGNSDAGRSAEPNDISEQTYEDLLATAILNKVIEKYQNENVDGNGNAIDDKPETTPRTKYITSEIEVGLDEGVEEGSSSLEPLSQDEYSSDCSAPVSKYSLNRQEPLSLTIEEHIEEVTTTYTSDEEEEDNEESNGLDFRNAHRVPFPEFGMDIIDPSQESSEETQDEAIAPNHVDLVTNVESWEENWLFQKKKIQAQSEPVSMLVPNPSEDFKPLIGDREADDTSDLSDCAAQSDEEIEEEILEAINNVVLKTPETTEVNGTNGIVTARSQIGGVSVTIGEFNSVKNSVSGSKREEFNDDKFIGAEEKGKNEEKEEGEALRSPHIKLGFEDMLVFHLKDNRSSSVASETRRHNNNSSSEFVGKERLLLGPTSGADKIDDVNLRSTESNSKAETRDCREKKDLSLKSDTTYSVVENTETRTANIVERKVEDVVNVVRSSGIDESTERFEKIVETTSSTKDRELLERKINVTVESKVKSIEIGSAESSLLTKENNVHVENRVKPQLLGRDAGLEVNEFVVNSRDGFKLGQDPEESRLSVDETDGSEVDKNLRKLSSDSEIVVESFDGMKKQCADVEISKDEENQFINHNDDLDLAELPRTPTSSPRMTEATEQETGNNVDFGSLDEKLVSIENRDGFAINSLNETVNSFVRSTERVRSSLDIVTDRFTELEQGVVEAKLIFLDNENERSNISKTEIQEIDLHNEDGAQQESEYTEHYATATQRHLDSLTRHSKSTKINEIYEEFDDHDDIPPPIPSTPPPINRLKQCRKAAALATAEVDVSEPQITERKRVEVDVFLATPPRPGTIAEREHKKWENAAPLENNPYSEENIQKRLWQRQYSRKLSSDTSITGDNNSETPKMTTGTPMQVVLGAGQPDFKRYGRDYYINDAKKANGERTRRSAMLNTVRRNSSLSQTSGSYDEDIEPQDKIEYQEPQQISNTVTEVKAKVSTWQQNNIDSNYNVSKKTTRQRVETTIHLGVAAPADKADANDLKVKSIEASFSEVDKNSWSGQNDEEILENVRRNSKNELNAKLNNQEDVERTSVSETKKSFVSETQKSVNRLDLKAFGFENEIKSNGSSFVATKMSEKRVVNKLDLKSFGYDSELQRIQSTGHIDTKLNNELNSKPRIIKMKTKSNLTEHHVDYEKSKSSHNLVEYVEASGDFEKTKSVEILKEDNKNFAEVFEQFGGMMSAKSMPNVTKIEHYAQNFDGIQGFKDEEDLIITQLIAKREKIRAEEKLRQEMIRASAKRRGLWKSETVVPNSENEEGKNLPSEDEVDDVIAGAKFVEISAIKEIFENTSELNNSSTAGNIDEELPMPSVRKLAQTFVQSPANKPIAQPRILRPHGKNVKSDRPTTPEIQLIETPRQMHSLTARSLSREFREGLRQIPNKLNSQPLNQNTAIERMVIANEDHKKLVSSTTDKSNDDIVIAPGKLKNDIKFWERLQRQS